MYWWVELRGQGKALTCTSSQEHHCYLCFSLDLHFKFHQKNRFSC